MNRELITIAILLALSFLLGWVLQAAVTFGEFAPSPGTP